jgi:DNA mismatch repair protein MutS
VARLAGVPEPVIRRAREILHNLEQGELDAAGQPRLARSEPETTAQMALFEEPSARLAADLASLAVEELKPVEALVKLDEFVRRARTIAERR